jgi:hypothetical protein
MGPLGGFRHGAHMVSHPFWHPSLRLRILAPAALVAIPAIALLLYTSFERRDQGEQAVTQNAERLASLKASNRSASSKAHASCSLRCRRAAMCATATRRRAPPISVA